MVCGVADTAGVRRGAADKAAQASRGDAEGVRCEGAPVAALQRGGQQSIISYLNWLLKTYMLFRPITFEPFSIWNYVGY